MSLHPAVEKVLERVHGVTWHYEQFDFGCFMGVCGATNTGKRWAARFSIMKRRMPNGDRPRVFPRDFLVAYADKVEEAKKVVMDRLFSGEKCVEGDEVMVGNETPI